ncbi:MAG: ABC transporter ATP-binding protein [Oligoflexia bacterium]|nr:ABC transporter ATP-binding protein [Oligoflexia bacterium]
MIEVKNLSVKFADFYAVKNISFTISPNGPEIFGLLGANGAGKTTTIKVLCGLLTPSEGEVIIDGHNLKDEDGAKQFKTIVGYMSQKFTLYHDLTVEENLYFTSCLRKIPSKIYHQRKEELLNFIGFNKPLNTLVSNLPGGIKQQVALVASILHNPKIIFLDEPTAGVTPIYREKFWNLIKNLVAKGKTVLVTTHYMDEAGECHRISLMRSGEIIALNTPSGLKEDAFPGHIKPVTLEDVFLKLVAEGSKDD